MTANTSSYQVIWLIGTTLRTFMDMMHLEQKRPKPPADAAMTSAPNEDVISYVVSDTTHRDSPLSIA